MSPRTAQLKLTSEERCKAAFEKIARPEFNPVVEHEGGKLGPMFSKTEMRMLRWGWNLCWQHLEKEVMREFIER